MSVHTLLEPPQSILAPESDDKMQYKWLHSHWLEIS